MEEFETWWDSHCYGNDKGGVVYTQCREAWDASRIEPVNRLNAINQTIFATGAPLGTPDYFKIRELATLA